MHMNDSNNNNFYFYIKNMTSPLYIAITSINTSGTPAKIQFQFGVSHDPTTGALTKLGTCLTTGVGDFVTNGIDIPQFSDKVTQNVDRLYIMAAGPDTSLSDFLTGDVTPSGGGIPILFGTCTTNALGNFLSSNASNFAELNPSTSSLPYNVNITLDNVPAS